MSDADMSPIVQSMLTSVYSETVIPFLEVEKFLASIPELEAS